MRVTSPHASGGPAPALHPVAAQPSAHRGTVSMLVRNLLQGALSPLGHTLGALQLQTATGDSREPPGGWGAALQAVTCGSDLCLTSSCGSGMCSFSRSYAEMSSTSGKMIQDHLVLGSDVGSAHPPPTPCSPARVRVWVIPRRLAWQLCRRRRWRFSLYGTVRQRNPGVTTTTSRRTSRLLSLSSAVSARCGASRCMKLELPHGD